MSDQIHTGIYYASLSAEETDAEVVTVEPERYRPLQDAVSDCDPEPGEKRRREEVGRERA